MIAEGEILQVGSVDEIRRSPHPLIQRFLTAEFNLNAKTESS
jgi:ABC-type transporter Mla maintaining outer membrane lipid asymmetry ATPase subunit MlaF